MSRQLPLLEDIFPNPYFLFFGFVPIYASTLIRHILHYYVFYLTISNKDKICLMKLHAVLM